MSTAEPSPARDLLRRAAGGAGIGALVAGGSRLLFFAQQLVLARLLLVDEFGQFAFALLVVGLPALLANLRGAEALVQSDADEAGVQRLADTAFTSQLIVAVGIAGLLALGSGPLAGVLGKPYLAALLPAMALLVLTSTGGPSANSGPLFLPAALLERRLDFVRARLPELANVLVNAGCAIALALLGAGVWSLIAGAVVGSAAQAALLWRLAGWRPRLRLDAGGLAGYLRFGWPLYLSFLLSWGYLNADYYFVGRWLGEQDLGYYFMAFSISQAPLQVRFVLGRVAFPAFARARGDAALLTRLYAGATRYATVIAGGLCGVGIGLATPVVALLLGPRWLPAAPALQVLLLSTLVRTGLGFNGDLLLSLGRTRVILAMTAGALVTLLLLGPALMARWGIQGMAWAVVASSLVSAIGSSLVIRRHVPVRYGRELAPALICLMLVAAVGLALAGSVRNFAQLVLAGAGLLLAYVLLYSLAFDRTPARLAGRWLTNLSPSRKGALPDGKL